MSRTESAEHVLCSFKVNKVLFYFNEYRKGKLTHTSLTEIHQ